MPSLKTAIEVPVVIDYDEDGICCVSLDFDEKGIDDDITDCKGDGFNVFEQAEAAVIYELERQADMREAMLEDAAEARMEDAAEARMEARREAALDDC